MPAHEPHLSRRAALSKLVNLPQTLLSETAPSARKEDREEELGRCAQELAQCWHESKGHNLLLAQEHLAAPLKQAQWLACQPAWREQAAPLVAQAYQLAGILASHHANLQAREQFCQQAVFWSEVADDASLLVTSRTKLGLTFHYREQPLLALRTYQEAWPHLAQASPLARSSFAMKQAEAYARLGQRDEAEEQLCLAHQGFPAHPEADPAFLYADCGWSSLALWEGLTHLALSQTVADVPDQEELARAWQAFEQGSQQALSERNRLEMLNYQAKTAVLQRHLDAFTDVLTQAVQGTRALGSLQRRQEAIAVYWQARQAWPEERRVKHLAELFLSMPG